MSSERDLDELAREFERDGFVNGGQVIDAAETATLVGELERYVDGWVRRQNTGVGPPAGYVGDLSRKPEESHYQMACMWKVSDPFRRLIENTRIVQIAARLTGTKVLQVWRDTVQYKPAEQGAPFHWHQDAPYHVSIEPPEKLIGAWVSFDDADEESGCMWMVPGSHRWGQRMGHLIANEMRTDLGTFGKLPPPDAAPEIASEWRGAVPCRVRAGEVHFHHAMTWHGSPTNRSGRPRRAYTIFFMPEGVRVSAVPDFLIPVPEGTPMLEAGSEFPIVYRASS